MADVTMLFAFIVGALAIAIAVGGPAHRALAGARARRRAAWEVDRAEWRRWITRP